MTDDGPLTAALDLPLGAEAAGLARRAVTGVLAGWDLEDEAWAYDVLLVASELVGNAARHGAEQLRLALELGDEHLTVSVSDGSAVVPEPQTDEDGRESGRGLVIVDAVAEAWGVQAHDDGGKTVWARIALPEPTALPTISRPSGD